MNDRLFLYNGRAVETSKIPRVSSPIYVTECWREFKAGDDFRPSLVIGMKRGAFPSGCSCEGRGRQLGGF